MLKIGCHLSSGGGYVKMYRQACEIGGNTFQFFTRNPRGGKAKTLNEADLEEFVGLSRDFAPIVAHAPYTLNCASSDPRVREFALKVFNEDLDVLNRLPSVYYNFHPGSHVGQGEAVGIDLIADLLNRVMTQGRKTMILLETMAGKGSEIGATFSQLRAIIDRVEMQEKLGVCLDTCHIFDGGYPIDEDLDGVLSEFDRIIGLDRLKVIHLNDSKNPRGSHKDRHEKIGRGYIGIETFRKIVNHPKLRNLPFLLETPNELDGYREEIALLKEMRGE